MVVARETYYVYMRNLKVWLAQPAAVISTIMLSVFMFLFFAAPLGSITRIPSCPR